MNRFRPIPAPPHVFAEKMKELWENTLGNVASEALVHAWMQLADCFGSNLLGCAEKPITVYQMPTGAGKTQGTALYLAIHHGYNKQKPVGVLFVARLKSQCDEMADLINGHAGAEIAFVHHSGKPLSYEEIHNAPILIITHEALTTAMKKEVKSKRSRWLDYTQWSGGERKLTIIDEALSNLVQEERLSLSRLRTMVSIIPNEVRDEYRLETDALDYLLTCLDKETKDGEAGSVRLLWDGIEELPVVGKGVCFDDFRTSMREIRFDKRLFDKEEGRIGSDIQTFIDQVLRSCEAFLSGYCLYVQNGAEHYLATSELILPDNAPPTVVLDATAEQSDLWHLMDDRASIVKPSQSVRNYSNVCFHVSRSRGLGKDRMIYKAETRFPRLRDDLDKHLARDRKLLLVTQQKVEPVAAMCQPQANTSFAHWGAIDGKNDWQDNDCIALLGLPYRDTIWPVTTYFALKGVQSRDWLASCTTAETKAILQDLQRRHISVSALQAINRVQCRRVIDEEGNCPPTDVFICLPVGKDGDAILSAIETEMPGIRVQPWSFQPDPPRHRVRQGSSHEALLSLLEGRQGRVCLKEIATELEMSPSAVKELKKALADESHPLALSLAQMGWQYEKVGRTKGARSYLFKGSA